MTKDKVMTISEFCEEFEAVDHDTLICMVFVGANVSCRKSTISIYETESGSGFRYFVDGSDVDTHGWFDEIVKCVREEDQFGTEYSFFDNRGKCLVCIGVLKV